MFTLYPDLNLKVAYWLSKNLRAIFSNKNSTADTARLNLARWYNRGAESGFKSFNTIAATGVKEDNIDAIADATLIFPAGYHELSRDEVVEILKRSL